MQARPHPDDAHPRRGGWRPLLWTLPLLLSLVFVAGVLAWVRANELAERELERQTLITDALSTEAQLRNRIAEESALLRRLAAGLAGQPAGAEALAARPEVNAGLRRLWLTVTWLDTRNRQIAQLPPQGSPAGDGLTLHLVEPVGPEGRDGKLVVRYDPSLLLKNGVPWWLSRKYEVQMIDSADLLIASTSESRNAVASGPSYRVSLTGPLRTGPLAEAALSDAALVLTLREAQPTALKPLALVLIAGFLPLSIVASWLLRRQMRQVMKAEAAWRTEAAWRQAMEDSALVGLRARDAEGVLLYVNRTFCELVGWPAEQLLGLKPPMPYWPPDAIDEVTQRNRRTLAGEAPREGYEARWRHRDGHAIEVLVFESPLVDAAGRQIGWMGSILDITERKRLEERERRQVETLAHNARLTMLGEVASTLAHELNQPLTAISSYNAGVLNSLERQGGTDPVVLGALQRLGQQAAQAGRVVQRIREFLTRREPQREPCELGGVIADAVALLGKELARSRIQLSLQLAPDLPEVVADAVLVEQVVINLVRNAADALAGHPEPRRIEVAARVAGERFVRIDVSDNGPGLQGLTAEQLCAPFYSTKREGMGMGLAICRSIVEAHQGLLDAGEASGGGARFSFSLPLATEDSQEEALQDV
ncbi:PAS domain-containing sensor histidine kinase [Pelomonas sp. SE-A7]|uniref:sensor histidine kinase n=1 Tax=Pelomonas sp. SE-A7 TaxID=3054953 RepID=UPI00259CE897|nr:PAS domain-containing sensor histidine kinase [Pelomonas sp. SE-A7]MDM4767923.1 PAS domain S-box protein [Pelomonas sp. SE-A7]